MDVDSGLTTEISGLTNGQTYTFSVEVTSDSPNILPGVSEEMDIRLCRFKAYKYSLTYTHTRSSRSSWRCGGCGCG